LGERAQEALVIAKAMLSRLQRAEESWKKASPKWKSLMEGYKKWQATKDIKASPAVKSKNKGGDWERLSKADIERDSAKQERSCYKFFDPNALCKEFSFVDMHKVEKTEIEDYFKQLEWNRVLLWLITALTRGIGIYHVGINRKY
jgi:ATP-dependent RNA helicase DDX60